MNLVADDDLCDPRDPEAQFSLAQKFTNGPDSDLGRAMQWYLKAAEQGHSAAQFHLALMYSQGKGGICDEAAALKWLQLSAERGHGGAQYHLGVRLYRASKRKAGPEASALRIESLKWLKRAVDRSYHGAVSAREFVLLGMTRPEVDEGERRAASTAADPGKGAPPPVLDVLL